MSEIKKYKSILNSVSIYTAEAVHKVIVGAIKNKFLNVLIVY